MPIYEEREISKCKGPKVGVSAIYSEQQEGQILTFPFLGWGVEDQRTEVTCSRSHRKQIDVPELEPGTSDTRSMVQLRSQWAITMCHTWIIKILVRSCLSPRRAGKWGILSHSPKATRTLPCLWTHTGEHQALLAPNKASVRTASLRDVQRLS